MSRLLAYRTRTRAEVWFFEPLGLLITLMILGTGLPGVFWRAPWAAAALLVLGSCWTTRLRLTKADPARVRLTTYWLVVPVRWGRADLASMQTVYADEFAGPDEPDMLEVGKWQLWDRRARATLEWLWASAAALGLPRAKLVSSR